MATRNPFDTSSNESPAINVYLEQNPNTGFSTFWDDITGKSDARQTELLGGTRGLQRRDQVTPSYEDWASVPYVIPDIPVPQERGAVSAFMDYLLRPASAALGIATGFLGMERYTKDRNELGDSISMAGDSPAGMSRADLAFVRAVQSLRGETKYKFQEFGSIARKKSEGLEIPFYQNAANVAAGFVVDTVFDPLTYVSFGGNLYGRRLGAKYVSGRVQTVADEIVGSSRFDPQRFLLQTYDSKRASAITAPALAAKMERMRRQALNENLLPNPVDRSALLNANFSPNQTVEELLETIRRVGTDDIDFVREIARDWLPDAAGMQYWTGGSRSLRKWLMRTMGQDEGMKFYNALPTDIQGGLRIRVPFIRQDGLPVAGRLIGGGGGQFSEKLSKLGIKQMEQFFDLTEKGRDVVRNLFFGSVGMRKLFSQGKFTDIAYDAIIQATGKRAPGRTAYVTYGDFERANWKLITQSNLFNNRQAALRIAAYEEYGAQLKGLPIEEQRKISRQVFLYLSDREMLKLDQDNLENLSPIRQKAIATASLAEALLDDYGAEIQLLGLDTKILSNFAPRMKTKRERARRAISEKPFTPAGGGKADTLKAPRDSHVFEWTYDMNEGAKVARWKVADDIFDVVDGELENPYISDFITSLFEYADDISRTLDSWRLAKIFTEAGVFTTKEVATLSVYSGSLIERAALNLVGIPGGDPGSLQPLKKRILDEFFEGSSEETATLLGGFAKSQDLAKERMDIARARILATDIDSSGVQIIKREQFDDYRLSDTVDDKLKDVKEVFESHGLSNSGTIRHLNNGQYQVVDSKGKVLSTHSTFGEARESARLEFAALRDGQYNNYIVNESFLILNKIDELLYLNIGQAPDVPVGTDARLALGTQESARLNLRYGLTKYIEELPPREREAAQRAINERTVELVRIFKPEDLDVKIDEFGNLTANDRLYQHLSKEVTEDFRNFLETNSWADLKNQVLTETGELADEAKRTLQQRIIARMDDVVMPRVVMDSYLRMGEVIANPESLWRTVYDPAYTMMRSLMTIARGPGFSGRNYMGGSYNGFLFGVGREHQTASGKVIVARMRTRKTMLEKYGDEVFQDFSLREEMEKTFSAELSKMFKGTGNYIPDVKDSDAIFELWGLAYNADIVGGSRSGRLIGEVLLRAPFITPRQGPYSIQRPLDQLGNLRDFIDVEKTMGGPTSANIASRADLSSRKERLVTTAGNAMQTVAIDNKWVRQYMGPLAANVEDQLRFASFLKGVQDFGLEPAETGIRGFSAATLVKVTQFDYTDLSPFELRVFKNIMPFWVWSRNNVPLQVRATINNPTRIARIGRGLEAAQSLFQEEYDGPMPSYADNQFNIYIDPAYWEGAPAIFRPFLPSGTVSISPFPFLDPLVDLNRWFKLPSAGSMNPLNWQEFSNNVSPLVNAVASFLGVIGAGSDYAGSDYKEAPRWAELIPDFLPGGASPDPMDPGSLISNQKTRQIANSLFPAIQLFERYFPWFFGDERQEGKWLTTMASALTGVTIGTIDDLQISNEQNRKIAQTRWYMERKYGPSSEHRMEMIRRLIDEGAPLSFIRSLDIGFLPEDQLDVERGVRTWRTYQQLEQAYVAAIRGVDDPERRWAILNDMFGFYAEQMNDEQRAAFEKAVREQKTSDVNITPGIWESLNYISGDFSRGIRAGAWQPPKTEELDEVGYERRDIDRLLRIARDEDKTEEERNNAVRELQDVHNKIELNRRVGMFTPSGIRVEDWLPEDE